MDVLKLVAWQKPLKERGKTDYFYLKDVLLKGFIVSTTNKPLHK